MAKEPKARSDQISVTIPPAVEDLLSQAVDSGLFGKTRGEVVRALVLDQLRQLLAEGIISRGKHD